MSALSRTITVALVFGLVLCRARVGAQIVASGDTAIIRSRGESLFLKACVTCHGATGQGESHELLGFDVPLPDFSNCHFAAQEPDVDWIGVIHDGGAPHGFSRMMPAFGDALTDDEIETVVRYLRTFCTNPHWPRGELNLPRAFFTEKAFPEDELVLTVAIALERPGAVDLFLEYERRFGARNEFTLEIPYGFRQRHGDDWVGRFGDLALGYKRVLYHSVDRGTILSGSAELSLSTGDEDTGIGTGTGAFEPFLSFAQILPADMFIQLQAGVGLPFNTDRANDEGFWNGVVGKTFREHRWRRTWTPMFEVLGAREFAAGEKTLWDVVPQMQVSLSRRQHVLGAVGLRLPLNETGARQTQFLFYILWDFFDGPFLAGW